MRQILGISLPLSSQVQSPYQPVDSLTPLTRPTNTLIEGLYQPDGSDSSDANEASLGRKWRQIQAFDVIVVLQLKGSGVV